MSWTTNIAHDGQGKQSGFVSRITDAKFSMELQLYMPKTKFTKQKFGVERKCDKNFEL